MAEGDDPNEAIWRGDEKAFEALARAHRPALERLLRRYTTSDDEARDMTQIALLRAYEHRASFRGEASFASWVFRIGVNAALSQRRAEAAAPPEALTDDVAFTTSLGTSHLVAVELWKRVEEHLATLPPRQRLVVELRVFHELTFEQIGTIVGSTEDAAKVNYHHAVKKLRAVLGST